MLNVFRRNPRASTIEALYGAIVAQARAPSSTSITAFRIRLTAVSTC